MTNSKKSEMVTILYFVTFIVALFSNINMIAEAPVKLYNYVVTVLFLLAKMWFCVSKEKNRYSVWINLAFFLAAAYVITLIMDFYLVWQWLCMYLFVCHMHLFYCYY